MSSFLSGNASNRLRLGLKLCILKDLSLPVLKPSFTWGRRYVCCNSFVYCHVRLPKASKLHVNSQGEKWIFYGQIQLVTATGDAAW
ncbi:hypothetical protein ACA910_008182 [Epithemia clementina (nom. ined.)]